MLLQRGKNTVYLKKIIKKYLEMQFRLAKNRRCLVQKQEHLPRNQI